MGDGVILTHDARHTTQGKLLPTVSAVASAKADCQLPDANFFIRRSCEGTGKGWVLVAGCWVLGAGFFDARLTTHGSGKTIANSVSRSFSEG